MTRGNNLKQRFIRKTSHLFPYVKMTFKVSTGVTKSRQLTQEVSKSNEQTYSFPLKCKGGKKVQGIAK